MAEPADFEPRGDYTGGRFALPERTSGEIPLEDPGDLDCVLGAGAFPFAADAVEAAVASARAAFPAWRDTSPDERRALLLRFGDVIEAESERLAQVIAREVGKPVWEARTEVRAALFLLSFPRKRESHARTISTP